MKINKEYYHIVQDDIFMDLNSFYIHKSFNKMNRLYLIELYGEELVSGNDIKFGEYRKFNIPVKFKKEL